MSTEENVSGIAHPVKNETSKNENSLRDVKIAIINVLKNGPMCVSELSITIGKPIKVVTEALHEMSGSVEVRKYSFLGNNNDFQLWGIARPQLPRILKKKAKKS